MTGLDSLATFIDLVRSLVDRGLEEWLPRPPACPPLVSEAMRYSLFAGGKRLRPALTVAAADAVARRAAATGRPSGPTGLDDSPSSEVLRVALPAACAIELIHTYSLIHDDLPAMDNDTLRRGRPTLHVVFGDGAAILAGDALQAEAFSLLAREPVSLDPVVAARKLRVIATVSRAAGAVGMVGGQAIDLQAAHQVPGHELALDAEGLRGMHEKKTGALITASAMSGAIMAGADDRTLQAVEQYAADLGLAFQIVDDILDVAGKAHDLGKTAGKDAAREKPTYPAQFGIERSRELAADCVARATEVLGQAGLTEGWLVPIATWAIERSN